VSLGDGFPHTCLVALFVVAIGACTVICCRCCSGLGAVLGEINAQRGSESSVPTPRVSSSADVWRGGSHRDSNASIRLSARSSRELVSSSY
jgi:hypothetical protein